MTRTTFRPTLAMTYPFSQGHQNIAGGMFVVRPVGDHAGYWPAGSMFTSVQEFARMALALLDGGRVDGKQALPAEVAANLLIPRVDVLSPAPGSKYGYGLSFEQTGGAQVVHHGGARVGYTSDLRVAPSRKAGVVVISNLSGGDSQTLARKALSAITGLSLDDRPKAPEMKIDPDKVAGVYTQGSQAAVVAVENGELTLSVAGKKAVLKPASGPCLTAAGLGTACFLLDAEGRASHVTAGGRALARR